METKNTIILVLGGLLSLSVLIQLFTLSLKVNTVQNDINSQNKQIENIQQSVDKVIQKLQANDIIFEE